MPLRSHVDLCLFIRMVRAEYESISDTALDDLEHSDDPERALRLWRDQLDNNPKLWFHEQYHYWQGLRLPFLFWYAAFSLRAIFTGLADFLATGAPFETWSGEAPMLDYLSAPWRCLDLGGGSLFAAPEATAIPPEFGEGVLISPLDLIEGMASIAEWQVLSPKNELEDVRSFLRWSKRNPAYLHAFRFVAASLEDEALALRIFCALVEAAFHTSQPVRGFISLLNRFHHFRQTLPGSQTLAQREPVWWSEVFRGHLSELEYEADTDSLTGVIEKHPFCRLTLQKWIEGSWEGSDFLNPFLTPNARAWAAKEKESPAYSWLVPQPGWAPLEVFQQALGRFYPPLTILHFTLKNGTNRIIVGGDPDGAAMDFLKSGNLLTLLTAFSVLRRATKTHYNPNIRLCHHSDCPHYPNNFCNLYPVIPKKWQDCGFPGRVADISKFLEPVVRRGKWRTH
jgi:hypothetical protein